MARLKKRYDNPSPDPVAPIIRTQDEIDLVLGSISDYLEYETTEHPSLSYEQGINAMYDWLVGQTDEVPHG